MSDVVIAAEGLGKSYRLRHQGRERYVALRDVLAEKARAAGKWMRGGGETLAPDEEEFWALRDISFEVRRGEVVGIIGRNGAGKSTLLKILSRITEPTEGRVRLRGRVASLLEVGTGFHPELTGRENIFVNGSILGMTRAEVRKKFDEIVAFAEVEKFLDTPVKHYSTGMHVRLAFAVAAHLEPDILIVDEVLAVGDAEFQKKSLGKMREVSKGGRTVLFVSHNMAAVKSLTTEGLVLANGRKVFDGKTNEAIASYIDSSALRNPQVTLSSLGSGRHTAIQRVQLFDENGEETRVCRSGERMHVAVDFRTDGSPGLSLELFLLDMSRANIGLSSLHQFDGKSLPREPGVYRCELELAPLPLASGLYFMDVATSVVNSDWDHLVESALEFEIPFANPRQLSWDFKQSYGYGCIALMTSRPPRLHKIGNGRE